MQRFAARDYWLFPFGLGKLYKQMFKGVGPLDWMELFAHLAALSFIADLFFTGVESLIVFALLISTGLIIFDWRWLVRSAFKSEKEFRYLKCSDHVIGVLACAIIGLIYLGYSRFDISAVFFLAGISHIAIDAIFRRLKEKYSG